MIILGWNRDYEEISWPDYDQAFADYLDVGYLPDLTWSVGRHKNIPVGSYCALVVQGQKFPRGLVAIGYTTNEPFADAHWDPTHGGLTNYVTWDAIAMLPADDPIPVSVLAERVAGPPWLEGIQGSGYTVPDESEADLLLVWSEFAGPFSAPPAKLKKHFREGARKSGVYTRYERNPMARLACLDHYGYRCVVCGLDPIAIYGKKAGKRAMEVHHIRPLHTRGGVEHTVDHVKDLRPLCPTCHAAIHAHDPVPTPAEFRRRMRRNPGFRSA